MAMIPSSDGTEINLRLEGRETGPTILFAHSVGCDLSLWDAQVEALAGRYRILRYDARGHGRSQAPEGDYTIAQLAGDALAVLDATATERAHLCGLSLGGTLGQWLALHAPERLESLVLCDTAARLGDAAGWQARMDKARTDGMEAMADFSMTRFFSDRFREREPATVGHFREVFAATPAAGYAGCAAVLRDCDFTGEVERIRSPTLVIGGVLDAPTPPADSEFLASRISGARLAMLDTGHLSAVEDAAGSNAALDDHLARVHALRR
jgi:3-oxoadipate enol-lactonase